MLTRFMHDHALWLFLYGYKKLPKLTGELTSPSLLPLIVSLGRLLRVWPARLFLPAFLFLSLSSPHSHTSLTFNQCRWSTNRNGVSSSLSNRRSQTPRLQNLFPSGVVSVGTSLCVYRIAFAWSQRTIEGVPVAESLREKANRIGDSRKKRQRRKHAHLWQQFTRARFPVGQFPVKFGRQPIKLENYPYVHTYPANYVRVHFRHLGVYKESPVAYRAIRVRVS